MPWRSLPHLPCLSSSNTDPVTTWPGPQGLPTCGVSQLALRKPPTCATHLYQAHSPPLPQLVPSRRLLQFPFPPLSPDGMCLPLRDPGRPPHAPGPLQVGQALLQGPPSLLLNLPAQPPSLQRPVLPNYSILGHGSHVAAALASCPENLQVHSGSWNHGTQPLV